LWPDPGPTIADFQCIAKAGITDAYNAYPHSMLWFRDRLYIGTTRANLCALKVSKLKTNIELWPVECPDNLYDIDMRAQVHAWTPNAGWSEVFRAPFITGRDGTQVPRELGYRGMTAFKGESDQHECLYLSTYASARGRGCNILRSEEGISFEPIALPPEFGSILTLRLLVPFKGRLFTSPTGVAGGNPNMSNLVTIYETRDPAKGEWRKACEPGFGDKTNLTIFEMTTFGDHLYAGTGNLNGYQVWRTRGEGDPPYEWEKILTNGAYRGKNNQGVASFCAHKDALYIGSGIQHGGIDVANKTGPAGPELIRVHPDGRWDLIVGGARSTPDGEKAPLSGFGPGFNSPFNGYFWRMGSHKGWLYLGTFNWSIMMSFAKQETWPDLFRRVYDRLGHASVFENLGGSELYRSFDGENWLPVTTNGFDNPYNYGIRAIESTPYGVAIGTVNPFAPRVAQLGANRQILGYADNPRGGLEIWIGDNPLCPDSKPPLSPTEP